MPRPASPMTMPMAEVEQQGRQPGADREPDGGHGDQQHQASRSSRAGSRSSSVNSCTSMDTRHRSLLRQGRRGTGSVPVPWSPASATGDVRCPSLAGCPALELPAVSLVSLVALLVVVAVVVAVVGVGLVRRSFPQTSASWRCAGSRRRSTVLRDNQGVPQIYADNAQDLFRAQGYVAAQDRFFEMDLRRHITAGRLSELVGADGVETDKVIRTHGLAPGRRGRAAAAGPGDPAVPPGLRRRGQRLHRRDGLARPGWRSSTSSWASRCRTTGSSRGRRWTPWPGSRRWPGTCAATTTTSWPGPASAGTSSPQQLAEIFPRLPLRRAPADPVRDRTGSPAARPRPAPRRRRPPTPEPAAVQAASAAVYAEVSRSLAAVPVMLGRGDGIGSNSWVVSGSRTSTGKPLLANDPHLGTGIPGIWYQTGLHCRTVSAAVPVRRLRLLLLRAARRRHRPQPAGRLGLHQPRPRRQRLLPGEGPRGQPTCATAATCR